VISQDELAAIAAAIAVLEAEKSAPEAQPARSESRWKLAGRRPELELEDIRALR
jgi:hypothetical protein